MFYLKEKAKELSGQPVALSIPSRYRCPYGDMCQNRDSNSVPFGYSRGGMFYLKEKAKELSGQPVALSIPSRYRCPYGDMCQNRDSNRVPSGYSRGGVFLLIEKAIEYPGNRWPSQYHRGTGAFTGIGAKTGIRTECPPGILVGVCFSKTQKAQLLNLRGAHPQQDCLSRYG
jgi:hypothetical protein